MGRRCLRPYVCLSIRPANQWRNRLRMRSCRVSWPVTGTPATEQASSARGGANSLNRLKYLKYLKYRLKSLKFLKSLKAVLRAVLNAALMGALKEVLKVSKAIRRPSRRKELPSRRKELKRPQNPAKPVDGRVPGPGRRWSLYRARTLSRSVSGANAATAETRIYPTQKSHTPQDPSVKDYW